ncbi:hypothetical protein SBRCBS47491_003666 [Sporothrix bragantina]|uniref:C2H2-type domain-containing protein n=1 Tax=Sporothrix bragantina TaxID=671064 RepID=A0ABP0BHE7_9PEZI
MALDAPAVAYGLPSSKMTAARQHVQTLSARDREALLRALLEQYEHPQIASQVPLAATSLSLRSSAATSSASISAFTNSLFDCPPLREEAEEESTLSPPSPLQPPELSSTPSTTPADSLATSAPSSSSTASSSRWTAPSPTPSTRLRSQSMSLSNPQPLRSSFSASHLHKTSTHSRSRSFESTSSLTDAPAQQPLQLPIKKKSLPKPTLTIDTAAATSLVIIKTARPSKEKKQQPRQQQTQQRCTYWCTTCGEKVYDRTAWVQHDVACRGNERRLAGDRRISGSHGHSGAGTGGGDHGSARLQRAWGCGFCAAFLGSLDRYQAHVAGHFEHGRTLAHWHFANVIYGLLHQPAVHKPWKRLWAARVAALPAHLRPKATWSPGCSLLLREADDRQTSLQEALEFFDANIDSASTLALQADALAIYIAVPIDDDGQKTQQKHVVAVEPKEQRKAKTERSKQPETPPSPTNSTTNLLPNSNSTSSPPAPAITPSAKNAPLPVPPHFSTPSKPTNLSLRVPSSSSDATKKDGKRGSKLSPRRPSFFFKSMTSSSSISSPETAVEGTRAVNGEAPATRQIIRKSPSSGAKLSKPRPVAPSTPASASVPSFAHSASTTTTTITATRATQRHTTPSQRNNWADRPLPPLIMDDFSAVPVRSSSTTAPIFARMTTGYASEQPPAPPPKPGAYGGATPPGESGDWNSIATTIVEDIMAPVNALHIIV